METAASGMWRKLPDSNGYYSNTPSFEESSQLGQDAFLKILVAQLKHQDPMEPMNDKDFIAQMAQFSSLEQMTKLATAMHSFVEFQISGSLGQHSYMIGHHVYWQRENEDGELVTGDGIVKSVSLKDGQIYAELENGQKIPMKEIYRIEAVPKQVEDGNETPPDPPSDPVEPPEEEEVVDEDESAEDDIDDHDEVVGEQ